MSFFEDFLNTDFSESKPEKIEKPKKVERAQPEIKKPPERQNNAHVNDESIDKKINDKINERLLKLVSIGLKHELTLENLTRYFKETGKLKLYNLTRYFSDASPGEIDQMLHYLSDTGKLTKDKNGWYQLKSK